MGGVEVIRMRFPFEFPSKLPQQGTSEVHCHGKLFSLDRVWILTYFHLIFLFPAFSQVQTPCCFGP